MTNNRYAYIDSLRAIAALLVVWLHTAEAFLAPSGGKPGSSPLFDVAYNLDFGRIGVVLFFIISGFVIPSSLKGEKIEGLKSFVIKRFFRLYPLFWASIPFGLFSMWYIWFKPVSFAMVLANITMVPSFFGQEMIIGLYWTLAVEVIFYIICAIFFFLSILRSEKYLSITLVLLIICSFTFFNFDNIGHFKSTDFIYFSRDTSYTLTYIGFMFLGALLRRWVSPDGLGFTGKTAVIIFVSVWLWQSVSSWIDFKYNGQPFEYLKNTLRYNIAMAIYFLFTILIKINLSFMAWLGRISYSLYLLHPVVMYSLLWLTRYDAFHGWHISIYMALATLFTIILSSASYRYIESPFINAGDKLSKKITYPKEVISRNS